MSDYSFTQRYAEPGVYDVTHRATSTYLGWVRRGLNPEEWIATSPDGATMGESGSRESATNRLRRHANANGRLPS